jgi:hypothetical protein
MLMAQMSLLRTNKHKLRKQLSLFVLKLCLTLLIWALK